MARDAAAVPEPLYPEQEPHGPAEAGQPLELVPRDISAVEVSLGWDISPRAALVLLAAATLVGAVVRVVPFGGRAFPLNDGGLVYELVQTLIAHGLAIPFDVNYNGLEIPFSYPPVPLYLIGSVASLLNLPIPYAETFVAVGISILTIPMVYVVGRQLVSSRQAAVGGAFVFALLPNAFQWIETGGGAGRAVSVMVFLLGVHQALRTLRDPRWVNAANTGILVGLAFLTAPRGAALLLVSLVVLAAFRARSWRLLPLAVLTLLAAAATSAVWLNVVISRHGAGAVFSAIVAGSDPATSLKTLLSFQLSGAPILDVLSILGVVGAAALLVERRFLLPVWFVVLFGLDQRAGITFAMVPFALMASHAATDVVVRWADVLHLRDARRRWDRLATATLAAVVLLASVLGSTTASVVPDSPLRSVDDDQLAAMIWVRDHLNPESRFVVLSAARWETDAFGSWFPAVADMQNLAAVQGYEWLGLGAFLTQQERHAEVQACASHTIDCVETWLTSRKLTADYVIIPKSPPYRRDCCSAARESMRSDPDFRVVYDGPGATVGALLVGAAVTDPVLVGAGDIAACDSPGAGSTAALVASIPGTVITMGDNAYEVGSAQEFASCYDPAWGRFKDRTRPAPGNHDYYTPDATPYFNYFGASAGLPGEGWYSYDIGTWHIVVLNSDCAAVGGCGPGSRQLAWLTGDLASHPAACTLAIWHHPLFTAGSEGPTPATQDFWRVLYAAHADLILNGHEHSYQRFAPLTPDGAPDPVNGIREIVVGTGGRNLLPFRGTAANTEVRDNTTYGVIKLTLHPDSYDWQFIPVVAGAFSDSGSATCH